MIINKLNNRKNYFIALVTAAFLLVATSVVLFAQNDKSKLESRKSKLQREIVQMNKELEQTKKNKSANLNQLVIINNKIKKREELIDEIESELGGIDQQVRQLSDTIYKVTVNLSNLKSEYARIIYSTYRNRNAYNRLMFIFSSRNFNQAYKRLKYLQQYTEYRKAQVKSISDSQIALANKKLELEKRKSSKLSLKHNQERERNQLSQEKTEKDNKINSLTSQEKNLLVKLRDNEQALNKLQVAIEALIAAEIKKANEEKARKAAATASRKSNTEKSNKTKTNPKAGETSANQDIAMADKPKTAPAAKSVAKSNSMSVTAEDVALTGSFAGNRGKLPSPVDRGSIVSFFGEHPHDEYQNIKIKNNGIDILSAPGTTAKVIFEGEVSSVLFITNLNYVVIVRHGDFLTVYSNLSEVSVKKGDRLKIRQTVGTIATGQGESKARLHFELWQGTVVQNPSSWLKI